MKQPLLGVFAFSLGCVTSTVTLAQTNTTVAAPVSSTGSSPAPTAPSATATATRSESTVSPGVSESSSAAAHQSAAPVATASAVAPAVPPASKKEESKKDGWGAFKPCKDPDSADSSSNLSTDCSGIFGVRASVTQSHGVSPGDRRGLMISTEGEEYVRRGLWTARTLHRMAIGGGEAGFEGTLMVGWAGGIRIPLGPCRRHGPLLRLGFLGYIRGNDDFYASLLELPQLQFGYQLQRGKTVVEVGATGGAVLVGRNRIGDSERRVLGDGFEYGGYGTIQVPWMRFGVSAVRLPSNDGLSQPVDVIEGTLCARVGGFALCGDARRAATRALVSPSSPEQSVQSLYAGIALGVTRE